MSQLKIHACFTITTHIKLGSDDFLWRCNIMNCNMLILSTLIEFVAGKYSYAYKVFANELEMWQFVFNISIWLYLINLLNSSNI